MPETADNILEIEELKTSFIIDGRELRAVDGVSFSLKRGSTLALVGESGCGKSVTALSILRLIEEPGRIKSGRIVLKPKGAKSIEITSLMKSDRLLYELRGGYISLVFQEPMTALSPVHRIGDQICEALHLHKAVDKKTAKETAINMLTNVGIGNAAETFYRYPHEISGGMRQRVVVAMSLISEPQLLIADEPTTALDVTIQAQILSLLQKLQKQMGLSLLLITHDIGVVAQIADEVAVMYLGRIVEHAKLRTLIKKPRHPYTMSLLRSLPSTTENRKRLASIRGSVPSLAELPRGCPFHPRCDYAQPGRCDTEASPYLKEVENEHYVACLRAEEIMV